MSHTPELEKQFILRLPPEQAARLVAENPKQIDLNFHEGNIFTLTIDGQSFKGKLTNLPCILETHKSLDGGNLFKSGDIGQMLWVGAEEDTPENLTSGITPPTKSITERRWRKAPDADTYLRYERDILRSVRGGADKLYIEVLRAEDYQDAMDTTEDLHSPVPKAWRYVVPKKAKTKLLEEHHLAYESLEPMPSGVESNPTPSTPVAKPSLPKPSSISLATFFKKKPSPPPPAQPKPDGNTELRDQLEAKRLQLAKTHMPHLRIRLQSEITALESSL